MFKLLASEEARDQLTRLEEDPSLVKRLKAVRKTLGLLQSNPRHPSLQTHKYDSLRTREYDAFEAYAEDRTSGAYRVFWRYGPGKGVITVLSITAHP